MSNLNDSEWSFLIFLAGMMVLTFLYEMICHWKLFRSNFKLWFRKNYRASWGDPLIIAGILALVIRSFVFAPYKIPTGSMIPTFMVGDKIFVNKFIYRLDEPERGDIIVFKYPLDRKKDFVKRLVGLPGETLEIRNGVLLVDGEALTENPFGDFYYYNSDQVDWDYGRKGQVVEVPEGHYFALGDNSGNSSDSRNWGFVPEKDMIGKASVIWWPPKRIKLLKDS